MDHRDEFSKWISAVEEALTTENVQEIAEVMPNHVCGCGSWDCPECFPDSGQDEHGHDGSSGMEIELPLMSEEDDEYEDPAPAEKPKSGKGVKLGDIVHTTEVRPTGGQKSPMTYGEDNLDEDNIDEDNWYDPAMDDLSVTEPDQYDEIGRRDYQTLISHPSMNGDEAMALVDQIQYMQDAGLSGSSTMYQPDQLMNMDPTQLKRIHDEVMGKVPEEAPSGNMDITSNQLGSTTDYNQDNNGGNMAGLRESNKLRILKPTLFERIVWDEEINAILKESSMLDENLLDESTLSKIVGKQPGSKHLIQWLHRKHKLGNDAEIVPAKMNTKRLLWKSFKSDPDQFIMVICQNGVAGIKPDENFVRRRTEEFRKKGKEYNPGGDSTLPYEVVAFTQGGEEIDPKLLQAKAEKGDEDLPRGRDPRVIKARMGLHTGRENQNPDNIFNLIAEQLGPIRSVYLTGEVPEGDPDKEQPTFKGGIERDKMAKRADMKKPNVIPDDQAITELFKRIHPVLLPLATQALKQVTKTIKQHMTDGNGADAKPLHQTAHRLKEFITNLYKSGSTVSANDGSDYSRAIIAALEKVSGSRRGSDEFNQFVNDAASGNNSKLKPVIDALRDTLTSL